MEHPREISPPALDKPLYGACGESLSLTLIPPEERGTWFELYSWKALNDCDLVGTVELFERHAKEIIGFLGTLHKHEGKVAFFGRKRDSEHLMFLGQFRDYEHLLAGGREYGERVQIIPADTAELWLAEIQAILMRDDPKITTQPE